MATKKGKAAPKKGTAKKGTAKAKTTAKTAPKAAKKEVKAKPTEVTVVYGKAKPNEPIVPATGSRFKHNTAGQATLDLLIEHAGKKTTKEVGEIANSMKKENGEQYKFNLNSGYVTFALATHPEFFKVMSDGTYTLKKKFSPDKKAAEEAVRLQKERAERKANKKPAAKKSTKAKAEKPAAKKTAAKKAPAKTTAKKSAPPKKMKKPSKTKA